jgi:hypothetical protein
MDGWLLASPYGSYGSPAVPYREASGSYRCMAINLQPSTVTARCAALLLPNSNGTGVEQGIILNLGINLILPACSLVNSLTSKPYHSSVSQLPLKTSSNPFNFLKIITAHPNFNFNFASPNPEQYIELIYSTKYIRSLLSLLLFLGVYTHVFPLLSISLMSSTSSSLQLNINTHIDQPSLLKKNRAEIPREAVL